MEARDWNCNDTLSFFRYHLFRTSSNELDNESSMIERYQFVFGIDIIMIGHILFYTCFSTLWNWPKKVLQQHGHKTKTLGQAIMETLCKILC